jgi:hypothetical protein
MTMSGALFSNALPTSESGKAIAQKTRGRALAGAAPERSVGKEEEEEPTNLLQRTNLNSFTAS